MHKFTVEIIAAAALTIGAILASATGVSASDVMVMNSYARASATPAARAGAAYVTIKNHGSEADRLLAISSPAATSAELHRSVMDGEVMRMVAAGPVEIAPNSTLAMEPGGLHVMLTGLKVPLKQGDTLELTLTLEKSGNVTVNVPIGTTAAGSPEHSGGEASAN